MGLAVSRQPHLSLLPRHGSEPIHANEVTYRTVLTNRLACLDVGAKRIPQRIHLLAVALELQAHQRPPKGQHLQLQLVVAYHQRWLPMKLTVLNTLW